MRRQRRGEARRHGGVLAAALVCALLLGAAIGARTLFGAIRPPPIGGPFALLDDHGRPRTDRDFRGRFLLVFFGYTTCADVCPTTLSTMQAVLDRIDPGARRIQPLFITVDPRHDTPAVLRRYTASISPTLIGLTGTDAQLAAVERGFHVLARPDPEAGAGVIEHSAAIALLGPDGRFLLALPGDIDAAALTDTLRRAVPSARS